MTNPTKTEQQKRFEAAISAVSPHASLDILNTGHFAAELCDRLSKAIDHGGNEYRREAKASECVNAIRALSQKEAGNGN